VEALFSAEVCVLQALLTNTLAAVAHGVAHYHSDVAHGVDIFCQPYGVAGRLKNRVITKGATHCHPYVAESRSYFASAPMG